MQRKRLTRILEQVLNLSTAPFHEYAVMDFVDAFTEKLGLELKKDRFGNRIAVYRAGEKAKGKQPRIAFVAHMDHPGFELLSCNGTRAEAKWWGGVKREYFEGTKVCVYPDDVPGEVVSTKKDERSTPAFQRVDTAVLELARPVEVVPGKTYAQWDLKGFELKDGLVHTRAADDLCSVAVQLALLEELVKTKAECETWCIFTRAEENGFNGALALAASKMLPKSLVPISLETSKMLPGAEQGGGPVVRLGDKMSTYSPQVGIYLQNCAENLKKSKRGFRYQSKLMDGGVCEAAVFVSMGWATGAMAFPLGNYHNMAPVKGKGKAHIRQETVHIDDIAMGLQLMVEASLNIHEITHVLAEKARWLHERNEPFARKLKESAR